MPLIDTHAHLTFPELADQVDDILMRSKDAGVIGWINIGTAPDNLEPVMRQVNTYENMWAGLGYHPHDASMITDEHLAYLKKLCQHDKVVGIGECGLDYHYMQSPMEDQKRVFIAQLDLAVELQKPVIVHTREAFDDTMDILAEYDGKLKNLVIHCYGGDDQQTQLVIDRGYYVSFTGTITFKNSEPLRQVAKNIPVDRIMLETDCPYISPAPKRNIRPNEPALMIHTAAQIAEIHGLTPDAFADISLQTSKSFFNL